jgi:hypothetical protein
MGCVRGPALAGVHHPLFVPPTARILDMIINQRSLTNPSDRRICHKGTYDIARAGEAGKLDGHHDHMNG